MKTRVTAKRVTCRGETLTIAEWAKRSGLTPATIMNRLTRRWTPPEQAIFGSLRPAEGWDLTGNKYGRLEVLGRGRRVPAGTSGFTRVKWRCRCDCGTICEKLSGNLKNGSSLSCGCLHRERSRAASTTHGDSKSIEWHTWTGMKDRCTNERNAGYHLYGGRGIYVCAEWTKHYVTFLADMGRRPTSGHSIERIDNDGPYACGHCPDCHRCGITKTNCRWATRTEQGLNARRTKRLEDGRPVTAVARDHEIHRGTAAGRLRRGWAPADAARLPVLPWRQPLISTPAGRAHALNLQRCADMRHMDKLFRRYWEEFDDEKQRAAVLLLQHLNESSDTDRSQWGRRFKAMGGPVSSD